MASAVPASSPQPVSRALGGGFEAPPADAAEADVEILRQQVLLSLLGQLPADPAALHQLYQELLRRGVVAPDASSAAGARQDLAPASRFEQDFERLELLGRGAFGEVWRCRHRLDQREYAVKMVQYHVRAADSDRLQQRVLREAQMQANLAHPGIVRYHNSWVEGHWVYSQESRISEEPVPFKAIDFDSFAAPSFLEESDAGDVVFGEPSSFEPSTPRKSESPSAVNMEIVPAFGPKNGNTSSVLSQPEYQATLYIQTELCSKDTLHSWISQRNAAVASGQLSDEQKDQLNREACEIFAQVVDAVAHLHSQGLVHRDIKPSNILFARDGRVRIADFGLATAAGNSSCALPEGLASNKTSHTRGVGTPAYASPEQLAGAPAGAAGDVYSLGVILAELLCPVQTQMERAKLIEGLRNSGQLPPSALSASPIVERMVMDMTHPEPTARPTTWEMAISIPRLFSEVRYHLSAGSLPLTLHVAEELPLAQRRPARSLSEQGPDRGVPPVKQPQSQQQTESKIECVQGKDLSALSADGGVNVVDASLQESLPPAALADCHPGRQLTSRYAGYLNCHPVQPQQDPPRLVDVASLLSWQPEVFFAFECNGISDPRQASTPRTSRSRAVGSTKVRLPQSTTYMNENLLLMLALVMALFAILLSFSVFLLHDATRRGRHSFTDGAFWPGTFVWYMSQLIPFLLRVMAFPKAWTGWR